MAGPNDFTGLLSRQDAAKLARSIGVPTGDGRIFKRGVMVSAEDAQRAQLERERQGLLTQQTAGFRAQQEMLQREKDRLNAGRPSPQFLAPQQPIQGQPQQAQGQAQAPAGVPSPMLLAQANQIQRYQQNPQFAQQPPIQQPNLGISVAAGPNISTAPNGLPQGSIGYQRADGSYDVRQGSGQVSSFQNESQANAGFGITPGVQLQPAMPAPSPAFLPQGQQGSAQPSLANKTYTPQEIARMTPTQLASREAFDQQNAARKQQEAQTALETRKTESEIAKNIRPDATKTPDAFDVAYSAFKQSNPAATPEQTQKFIDDYRSKGTPQTNVNVGEGLIGKAYSGYEKSRNDIIAADETLSTLDEAVKEIESGKAFTGTGSQFKLQGAKIAQLLGSEQFNDEIAATEALASTIAQAALSQIQRLPGPASDKDIKFIQAASTGSSTLPGKETLRRIREIMARTVERNKTRYQQDIERTFTGDDQNAQFAKRSLALGGQAQAPQGQPQPAQPLKIGRFTVIQQ